MPYIRMETSEGSLIIELWADVAPHTAENFRQLVANGFYDGLTFHRVIHNFIVHGGCPNADGTGNAGWFIEPEFNDRPHDRGVISMARTADPGSGSSQFFICLSREYCEHLDGQYTAFGQVIGEGLETLERLGNTPLMDPMTGTPISPPQILHCYETWDEPMR
jgi:cyclophilin family peptidyl-prolyl cis-trans isomerase